MQVGVNYFREMKLCAHSAVHIRTFIRKILSVCNVKEMASKCVKMRRNWP